MCGILVIVRKGRHDLAPELQGGMKKIGHRGMDDSGTWTHTFESNGEAFSLGMGHVRLSIIDLSEKGRQPMADRFGNVIVHNGEIYNYLELRQELKDLGHDFRTDTDTEVILAAYRQWGSGCLDRFVGMWAFAIWNGSRLFISRDRLGKKPLFYSENKDKGFLALASEIKGLQGSEGIPWKPDERTVFRYLSFAEIESGGSTFFEGIREFPAGSFASHAPGEPLQSITRFWSLPSETRDIGEAEAIEKVSDLLFDSVRLRLRSDAPLGLSLSGGLDSTLLLALMNEAGVKRPPVFSSCYPEPGYNEREYFDAAVAGLGCDPKYAETGTENYIADFEKLVYHLEQPSKLPGPFSLWRVSSLAGKHVKVLIDGQGPDELSGGYMYFLPSAIREESLIDKFRHGPGLALTVWANRHILSQYSLPVILERIRGRPSAKRLIPIRKGWADRFISEKPGWAKVAGLNRMLADAVTKTSLPGLLRYGDRVNMAFGIENRSPFLDHRLVEFVSSLPPRMKIRGGTTKWIFRMAAKNRIPDQILKRRLKLGFPTPVGEWYRDILLNDSRRRLKEYEGIPMFGKWVDTGAAHEILSLHAEGRGDHQALLWRILSIGAWLKTMALTES